MSSLSDNRLKNLFAAQSKEYARYRPTYPDSLFEYLASLAPEKKLAWDCATGSGQAAVKLATHFSKVIATDLNENQLAQASVHPHVEYRVATAEKTDLPERQVDLITVAQAAHWFQLEEFYKEAKRVLKPGGIIALWCYLLPQSTPEIDTLFAQFCNVHLKEYWEKERTLVDEGYRTLPFPFKELTPPPFEIKVQWTVEHFFGYLTSWSACQTYLKKTGQDPLEADRFRSRFEALWPKQGALEMTPLEMTWKLHFRIGKQE